MATSKIPKQLRVRSISSPTNWEQTLADAVTGTITICHVGNAGTAVGSPTSAVYAYGSLITIKAQTAYGSMQIFVPDTIADAATKMYVRTRGKWLEISGTLTNVVTS